MSPLPLPGIRALEPYKGGLSSLPGFANVHKLSSNENALGCSPLAKAAAREAIEHAERYPDGSASALKQALSARYGLQPDMLVAGAGSDEIFYLLARAYLRPGDEIVQSQYAFLVYRIVAQIAGAKVCTAPDNGHTVDVDAMIALITKKTRLIFLANPNNPTGTFIPRTDLEKLVAATPKKAILVLDSAYAEYVAHAAYDDGMAFARAHPNVIVTRTFSKIHGLASLRLGWGYAHAGIIATLDKVRNPFNANGPASAAGCAALADQDFEARSIAHNSAWLPKIEQAARQAGLQVTPSVCNFTLVTCPGTPGRTAQDLDEHLRGLGIIVRAVKAYGLPDSLRLSVGSVEANTALIAGLASFGTRP